MKGCYITIFPLNFPNNFHGRPHPNRRLLLGSKTSKWSLWDVVFPENNFNSYVVAIFVCRYNSLMLIPLCLERVASLLRVLSPSQLWSLYSLTFKSWPETGMSKSSVFKFKCKKKYKIIKVCYRCKCCIFENHHNQSKRWSKNKITQCKVRNNCWLKTASIKM